MPLKDLVVYLGNKKPSGTLVLERGAVRKTITILGGDVVNAASNEPREYLGQFLINLGHITEDQFQRAYDTQRQTRVFLGQILVMIGAVTEEIIRSVLLLKTRETVLEPFLWADGTFGWEEGKLPESMQGLDVRVGLLELHREGAMRDALWRTVREAFPSGERKLLLNRANLAETPRAGSLDEKLYALIEAGSTIDELILALHATDFFLYQRLYALHRLGALRCADAAPRRTSPSSELPAASADVPSLVRDHLREGRLRDAVLHARRALKTHATPDLRALLQQAEESWLTQLREQLGARPQIPRLTASQDELKEMPLSAPERYLLSRIDGKRSLAAIVDVAPLRELDALAHFQHFVRQGLVRLEPT